VVEPVTKSDRITQHVCRAVAAPIVGLFGAVLALLPALLLFGMMQWLGAPASVFVLVQIAASMIKGFAFVFVGSLVATIAWRVRAACILVGLGILFYLCFYYYLFPYTDSDPGSRVSVWAVLDLAVTIAGGLSAVALRHFRRHEKTS